MDETLEIVESIATVEPSESIGSISLAEEEYTIVPDEHYQM